MTAQRHYQRTYTIAEAAKRVGMGKFKFFEQLRKDGVLCRDNLPTQQYINRGYLKVQSKPWTHPVTQQQKLRSSTVVTESGLLWLNNRYNTNNPQEQTHGTNTPAPHTSQQPTPHTPNATTNRHASHRHGQQSAPHTPQKETK